MFSHADQTPIPQPDWLKQNQEVDQVVKSPDGKYIAYAINDNFQGWIRIIDQKNGEWCEWSLKNPIAAVQKLRPHYRGLLRRGDLYTLDWNSAGLTAQFLIEPLDRDQNFEHSDVEVIYKFKCQPGPKLEVVGEPAIKSVPRGDE